MKHYALLALLLCACAPVEHDADGDGFVSTAYGGDDCCDDDARAYPGAEGWHTDPQQCGSYDWDCQAGEEPRWGHVSSLVYDCPASESELSFWPIASWQFDGSEYPTLIVPCGGSSWLYVGCNALATSPQVRIWHAQECR